MSLLYPLGLLALIAIPILIIIYIIKNKYTEQVISSTYLWTLSEKFLKRRNPIKRIAGLLSLILQILIVIIIAFSLTQPIFVMSGAARDYMFILDGSGSMNITASDGTTRLEKGKDEIKSIVSSAADGSTYTLVYAADTTSTLCDSLSDKTRLYAILNQIDEGYCPTNLTGALSVAQEKFSENPSMQIYLFTDKDFGYESKNVTCVNLSSGEENYAVSDVSYNHDTTTSAEGVTTGVLTVKGSLWSYESDAYITVSLKVDGAEEVAASQSYNVSKLEACAFELECDVASFSSFTVNIEQSDGLMTDNEYTVYSLKSDSSYNTLIVSDTSVSDNSFLIKSMLSSFGDVQITTIASSAYTGQSGYGLYIFDSYTPSALPSDGAVWFVNPQGSVSQSGFTVQSEITLSYHGFLSYSTSTSSRVQSLLEGTLQEDIAIIQYVKCSFSKSFYTLLSYESNPVLFAGTNSYGNREVVFAFDFHNTDFAFCADYIMLMYNLFNYTFPEIVSDTSFYCGDTIDVNVLANCKSIRVDTPLGNIDYLDTSSDVAEYTLTEAGTYTITVMIGSSTRQVQIFASVPEEERYTTVNVSADGALYTYSGGDEVDVLNSAGDVVTEALFTVSGTAQSDYRDGTYGELWMWFVALAVLFIADWGVYCYEQHQLR